MANAASGPLPLDAKFCPFLKRKPAFSVGFLVQVIVAPGQLLFWLILSTEIVEKKVQLPDISGM